MAIPYPPRTWYLVTLCPLMIDERPSMMLLDTSHIITDYCPIARLRRACTSEFDDGVGSRPLVKFGRNIPFQGYMKRPLREPRRGSRCVDMKVCYPDGCNVNRIIYQDCNHQPTTHAVRPVVVTPPRLRVRLSYLTIMHI